MYNPARRPCRGKGPPLFILPITHDNLAARRWPWVTTAFILACVIMHLAVDADAGDRRLSQAVERALRFQAEHPDLPVPAALRPFAGSAPLAGTTGEVKELLRALEEGDRETDEDPAAKREAAQDELLRHAAEVQVALDEHPIRQLGFVPSAPSAAGLVTHQFMHGGWLHLLSNLWFLWLCGCNLEDRWGRVVFAAFYLLAGAFAAFAHFMFTLGPDAALVGASGSVAGAMGAFLVLHARTRIRFVYLWPLGFRLGTFWAPAFIMLPLWALSEFVNATLMPESGVAHWAHVGGFAFGLPVALGLRLTGLEARLDAAVDATVTSTQDPRILAAAADTDAGRLAEAFAGLDAMAREQPRNLDVHLELLRAARKASDPERATAAYDRLIPLYLDEQAEDAALTLWKEVLEAALPTKLPGPRRLQLGQALAARQEWITAGRTFQGIYARGLTDVLAVRAAIENAAVALAAGRPEASERLLREVVASPHQDPGIEKQSAALREQLSAAGR